MSKHTPGPWAIYVNAPSDIVIRKMSKDGYELCAIARVSSGYANAHLIAAAPELLEALVASEALMRHMYKVIDWEFGDCRSEDELEADKAWPPEVYKARAAIAKATGENT